MHKYDDRPKRAVDYIFGIRAVEETLKSGKEIDRLLIQQNLANDQLNELISMAYDQNVHVVKVPIEKLNRITRKNHQGVICYQAMVSFASLDNVIERCYEKAIDPFVLILDRITDVRNFGAISRSAECAGVDVIVLPERGSAMINADAMKTSAGALNHIPVCRERNLKQTITYLQERGIQVVSCTEKTDKEIYDEDLTGPIAIIMGSEEDGISGEYLKRSDKSVKLPLHGKIASLNVSTATGIMLYEVLRQRAL